MILKVIDGNGDVIHDCRKSACSVSWDGIALQDLTVDDLFPDASSRPANAAGVAMGKKVPNAAGPDANTYDTFGQVAKLRSAQ